jgi:hypothetical protein
MVTKMIQRYYLERYDQAAWIDSKDDGDLCLWEDVEDLQSERDRYHEALEEIFDLTQQGAIGRDGLVIINNIIEQALGKIE